MSFIFCVVNIFQLTQGNTTQLCNDWVSIICFKFRPRAEPRVTCIEHRDFPHSSCLRTKGVYQEVQCHPNSSGLVHYFICKASTRLVKLAPSSTLCRSAWNNDEISPHAYIEILRREIAATSNCSPPSISH